MSCDLGDGLLGQSSGGTHDLDLSQAQPKSLDLGGNAWKRRVITVRIDQVPLPPGQIVWRLTTVQPIVGQSEFDLEQLTQLYPADLGLELAAPVTNRLIDLAQRDERPIGQATNELADSRDGEHVVE